MDEKKMENLHDLKDILHNIIENLEDEIISCKYLLENELYEYVLDKMETLEDSIEAIKAISITLRNYQKYFDAGS